jgi:hypothetical protein
MQGAVHSFGHWSAGPGHPIRSSALATTPTEIVRQLKLLQRWVSWLRDFILFPWIHIFANQVIGMIWSLVCLHFLLIQPFLNSRAGFWLHYWLFTRPAQDCFTSASLEEGEGWSLVNRYSFRLCWNEMAGIVAQICYFWTDHFQFWLLGWNPWELHVVGVEGACMAESLNYWYLDHFC